MWQERNDTPAMPCGLLTQLRNDAHQIFRRLEEKMKKAQQWPEQGPGAPVAGKTDYEPLLRHRLRSISIQIEEHLAEHGCESQTE